jgi:hypothetical protein
VDPDSGGERLGAMRIRGIFADWIQVVVLESLAN